MSGPNFTDIARAATTLENVAAISTTAHDPDRRRGAGSACRWREVSASLFNVLRVRPALGRAFNADENTPGRTNVVILSHALWAAALRRRPRASSGGASRSTACRGKWSASCRAGSRIPSDRQAWLPIDYDEGFVAKQRGAWYLSVVARLKPGVTPEQAAAEVETLGRNLARQYPDANAGVGMTTYPAARGDGRRHPALRHDPARRGRASCCSSRAPTSRTCCSRAPRRADPRWRCAPRSARDAAGSSAQLLTESVLLSLLGAGARAVCSPSGASSCWRA